MRVDQFLYNIRVYKTRTLATNACKKGHVRLNKIRLKPANKVYPGQSLEFRSNHSWQKINIHNLPKRRVGAKLVALYAEVSLDSVDQKRMEVQKLMYNPTRERGLGRPTKKDRREIDDIQQKTEK